MRCILGSGTEILGSLGLDFSCVIIDEAAQCVELDALIPLKYNCIKAVLIGDPQQLPATVLSDRAKKFDYDQSLFARYQVKMQCGGVVFACLFVDLEMRWG